MGVLRLVFWGLLIGVGVIAGFYVATGEVPSGGDSAMFDDPSREEVNGKYITRVELRENGVYAVTDVTGLGSQLDIRVTLPSGETHEMRKQYSNDIDEPDVYTYEKRGLPAGNYTISRMGIDYSDNSKVVEDSYTVSLEPPSS